MPSKNKDHIGEEFGIYKIIKLSPNKTKDGHKMYEAVCKECGFVKTARYQQIKDGVTSVCTHRNNYRIHNCLHCGKEIQTGNLIPSEYNDKKFCNSSCAASYNNLNRQTKNNNKRNAKAKQCLNCGKEIPNCNKYCSIKCMHEHKQSEWENKWLNGEINGNIGKVWIDASGRVKTYLLKKYNSSCARCGWCEVNPYTGNIPLEIEHIDGNPYNTTPENVTLLCPNCHSLTKTYKGANKGSGRKRTWIPSESFKSENSA